LPSESKCGRGRGRATVRPRPARALGLGFLAGLSLGLLVGLRALPQDAGALPPERCTLTGRLTLPLEGVRLAEVAPLVAYLDGVSERLRYPVPREVPVISQKDAHFSPSFLIVAAGQTVSLTNDDRIVHNVFSFSPPKRFDLGLYPEGEKKQVTFDKPGATDLFCSIHSKMNATVFVAPSPYYAQVSPSGAFLLTGVPPGSYRLKVWSRKLPEIEREVLLGPGAPTAVEIVVGTGAGARTAPQSGENK
jgi:plastocyanin